MSIDLARRNCLTKLCHGGAYLALCASIPKPAQATMSLLESDETLQNRAEYSMVFASPYDSDDSVVCPHMHRELKHNIQTMSGGRIFVDIQDKGKLGIGHELMASLIRGQVSAALVSVSNLSPAAPVLDILNIPFWSARSEDYLNLITSQTWKSLVLDKIKAQGKLEVLFHYLPGARTVSSSKKYGKVVKQPSDLTNTIFRVPKSQVLRKFYQSVNASVVDVNWKNVATLAESGKIQAFDPGIVGLYNGPGGLKNQIAAISQIQSVHDGWLAVVSQKWLSQLPMQLRLILQQAAEKTFVQHLQQIRQVRLNCIKRFEQLGTIIYTPSEEEQSLWIEQCGPNNRQWADIKKHILGSEAAFEKLVEATKVNNGYRLTV